MREDNRRTDSLAWPTYTSVMERPRAASPEPSPEQTHLEQTLTPEEWKAQLEKELQQIRFQGENILFTPEERESRTMLRTETIPLHGRQIAFYGVLHTAETYGRYEKELREGVRKADVVVLEGGPEIQLGEYPMAERIAEREGPDVRGRPLREVRQGYMYQLSGNGWEPFFHAMENAAAIEEKPVALLDQFNLSGATKEEEKVHHDRWEKELPPKIFNGGATMAAAGIAALGAAEVMRKNEHVSRRNFLRGLGIGAAAVGAVGMSSQLAKLDLDNEQGNILHMGDKERKVKEAIVYSLNDLRNVLLAERLEILAKTLPEGASISVFYGDGHRGPVKDYLQHPALREAKKQAYKLARSYIAPNTAIGSWKFDFEEGRWKEQPEGEVLKTKV